jgi:hypothetical protein
MSTPLTASIAQTKKATASRNKAAKESKAGDTSGLPKRPTSGSFRGLSDAGHLKRAGEMFAVNDPFKLEFTAEHALRDYNSPRSREKIEAFKAAWRAKKDVPPIEICILGPDRMGIEEGGHRTFAARELHTGGFKDFILWAIPKQNSTPLSRAIRVLTAADGLELSYMEKAHGYANLRDQHKLTNRQIAEETGIKPQAIEQALVMWDAPQEVKALVESGRVPAMVAIDQIRAHKKDAGKVLKAMCAWQEAEHARELQALGDGKAASKKAAKALKLTDKWVERYLKAHDQTPKKSAPEVTPKASAPQAPATPPQARETGATKEAASASPAAPSNTEQRTPWPFPGRALEPTQQVTLNPANVQTDAQTEQAPSHAFADEDYYWSPAVEDLLGDVDASGTEFGGNELLALLEQDKDHPDFLKHVYQVRPDSLLKFMRVWVRICTVLDASNS